MVNVPILVTRLALHALIQLLIAHHAKMDFISIKGNAFSALLPLALNVKMERIMSAKYVKMVSSSVLTFNVFLALTIACFVKVKNYAIHARLIIKLVMMVCANLLV